MSLRPGTKPLKTNNALLRALAAAGASGAELVAVAGGIDRRMFYSDLDALSDDFAAAILTRFGPADQQWTAIALSDPIDFVLAFLGVIKSGRVPVPVPAQLQISSANAKRFTHVCSDARVSLVITDQSGFERQPSQQTTYCTFDDLNAARRSSETVFPAVSRIAYVQYTSGSTSDPKPILLSHDNVAAQLRQAAAAYKETHDSVAVTWVPLFHDMGLVTAVLRPMFTGYRSVILSPTEFVKDPSIWLRELTRWKATHTSAPDFGYALTTRRAKSLIGIDLGAVQVARNAGEPVNARTLDDFVARFEVCGFNRRAFSPSYGLAEATLTVSSTPINRGPTVVAFDRAALRVGEVVVARPGPNSVELVSSGRPLDDTTITIVGDDGREVEDRLVGLVRIEGPQVAAGRHDSGDRGFVHDGELFLLGRNRDRFQINGLNYYSNELDQAVAHVNPIFRAGRIATFPSSEPSSVIVVAELRTEATELQPDLLSNLEQAVRRMMSKDHGLRLSRLRVVSPGTLPVTSSGKLRRERARDDYEEGIF